ncbi:unnamed protein product [Lepidochelys kempii]
MEGKSTAENNGSWRQSALLSLAFEKQLLLQNTSQGLHKTWNSGFAPRQNKLESDPVVWTQAERIDDPAAVQEMQTYSSSAAQHSLCTSYVERWEHSDLTEIYPDVLYNRGVQDGVCKRDVNRPAHIWSV